MSHSIIQVQHLSKAYRIGVEAKKSDTMAGAFWQTVKAPWQNLKDLRNLRSIERDQKTLFWALRDVNFEVKEGEVLGIIGHNGAGKSTLLKILSRITEPTEGRITIHGRVSSLLEVGTGFHPELTGRENIYMNGTILGMRKKEIDQKLDEIIAFSDIVKHIDTPVKRYSSGMTVRLAFSVAAHLEPEILVIDEVLAVGDLEFQKKCLGKMRDVSTQGRTVIFVSHNMGAIKGLCTKGLLLKGGVVNYYGGVDDTIKAYVKNRVNADSKGLVLEGMRQFHTGEITIERITLLAKEGNATEDCYYREDLDIRVQVEAHVELKDLLVDVKITSEEGIVILHSLNTMMGRDQLTLATGRHHLQVTLPNRLAPGSYSISAGVHHSNGMTMEHVEDVYPFTVLKVSGIENESYKYEWVHGYMHEPGTWQILK